LVAQVVSWRALNTRWEAHLRFWQEKVSGQLIDPNMSARSQFPAAADNGEIRAGWGRGFGVF
jgi:hypothetical protein